MPSIIQCESGSLQVDDDKVQQLIQCAVQFVIRESQAAVHQFNAADPAGRHAALAANRSEPWRAFLSPDAEAFEDALADMNLKPKFDVPPLRPLGPPPKHEMRPSCGGDAPDLATADGVIGEQGDLQAPPGGEEKLAGKPRRTRQSR